MKRIELLSAGVLHRNPEPGLRAECAFLPNLAPLSDTEVLCVYRLGQAFYSVDGSLARLRSVDGGATWVREAPVWDPADDERTYSYSAPHLTRFQTGHLALVAFRQDYTDTDLPLFNRETGGVRPHETILFRSRDNGHSWGTPQQLDAPYGGIANPPSQIIELSDRTWWLAWERWKDWSDKTPLHIKGSFSVSRDQGKSWSEPADFPSAGDAQLMYSHGRFTKMLDGRIAALHWTQQVGSGEDLDLHLTTSDLSGTTWTDPAPTGIAGQTSWLADLGDGVLAAAYTTRAGRNPGIMMVLSEDEGRSWDTDNQLQVWDAVGQEFLGVARKPDYPASHDNIAYGKPNLARLPGGELICSWWCTQACVTHARFARLAVR